MTLIASQASHLGVIQVTDRLVTLRGQPFDDNANKCLIYAAPDGLVTIAYTGLAYLAGLPTDQWIAGRLIDAPFMQGERVGVLRSGAGRQAPSVGGAVVRLEHDLAAAFDSLRGAAHGTAFEILLAGWQWGRRKHPRPVMIGIKKQSRSSQFRTWRAERHLGRRFLFAITPRSR